MILCKVGSNVSKNYWGLLTGLNVRFGCCRSYLSHHTSVEHSVLKMKLNPKSGVTHHIPRLKISKNTVFFKTGRKFFLASSFLPEIVTQRIKLCNKPIKAIIGPITNCFQIFWLDLAEKVHFARFPLPERAILDILWLCVICGCMGRAMAQISSTEPK